MIFTKVETIFLVIVHHLPSPCCCVLLEDNLPFQTFPSNFSVLGLRSLVIQINLIQSGLGVTANNFLLVES